MTSHSVVRVEALSKDNFDTWKIHMKAVLVKNHTWGYVAGTMVKPEPEADDAARAAQIIAWEEKDSEAMSDIILAIQPSELKQIKDCTTARELWQKLETIYQSRGPARKATLLKQIILQRMSEGDDVRDHLGKFFDAVDKLRNMEVTINDDLLSILLLYSLPAAFENFRCAIESRDELPGPESLRVKIVEESDARTIARGSTVQNSMIAQKSLKSRNEKKLVNKTDKDEKVKNYKSIRCFHCKKLGHMAKDCRSRRSSGQNNANAAGVNSSLYTELAFSNIANAGNTVSDKTWCLDSGCTSHMCKDLENFSQVENGLGQLLKLANNSTTKVSAKGVVPFSTSFKGRDKTYDLRDTLYVPDLRTNLLSVGKIVDKGHRVTFDDKCAEVVDKNDNTLFIAQRVNGLYYVDQSRIEERGNVAQTENREKLSMLDWHIRMGHLNVGSLRGALKKGRLRGIDIIDPEADFECETCLQGKMVRNSFPKKTDRKTEPGELIHSDVCGPMRIPSNANARYFVTLIDDATRWCEVRFIRQKSEVVNKFRYFKKMIETQKDRKIKFLQSDNGTEYLNRDFDVLLKNSGIQRRLTVPNNPEQNGVAERKNRTLIEMTRCLLVQSGLPASFWAEALSTANFILNRCPTSALDGHTPYESWNGEIPDVGEFQSFGCDVYWLDRSSKAGKLDHRGKKGKFLGYDGKSKGFRVYVPEQHRVVISRDVKFLKFNPREPEADFEDFYPDQHVNSEKDPPRGEPELDNLHSDIILHHGASNQEEVGGDQRQGDEEITNGQRQKNEDIENVDDDLRTSWVSSPKLMLQNKGRDVDQADHE